MGYVSNNETLRTGDNFGYGRQWRPREAAMPAAASVQLLGVAPGEGHDHPPKDDDQQHEDEQQQRRVVG